MRNAVGWRCTDTGWPSPTQLGRHDRHARHDSPVALAIDRAEMDVHDTNWASRYARGDPAVGRPDGGGESYLGLHADPRGAEERRPSRRSLDDCAHREGARPATRPAAADVVADFLRAHWGAIAGADFFTTEVWTWRGLVTY